MEIGAIKLRRIALRGCQLSLAPSEALWGVRARFPLLAAVIVAIAFTLAADRGQAEQPRAANVIGEYALAQPNAIVSVPVTIGTDKYNFMLDTGATRSSIDSTLRPLLGKRLTEEKTSTMFGRERVAAYEAPSMAIGDTPLPRLECIWCVDEAMNSRIFGERIDGELGMDVLQDFVIQIDCDESCVRFLSSASDADGTAVALHRSAGAPFAVAHFGSAGQQLVPLTAGSGGPGAGMLDNRIFSRLLDERELETVSTGYMSNFSHPRETVDGRVSTIRVGDHTIEGAILARGRDSALSLGFFSRFVATFDFPNDVMYLRPGKQFAQGQRSLSCLWRKDFDEEVVVPSAAAALHSDAILARMLFQKG